MAEEGDRKNHPSLPSNYVTLVQLQERWLQEQQRKQREKEEKEEEKPKLRQREKEEEEGERKREDQENSDQKRQSETNTPSRLHLNRPPFRNSRWISSDKSSRVSERKSEESQFGGKSKIEDLRKKKKEDTRKAKGEKKGKTRAEEDLIECTEQLFPKNEDEDQKIPVVSTERDSDFQRNGKSLVANGMDLKKRNKRKNRRNWKPRAEKDLTGGTEQLLPDNVDEGEKIPVISTERDSDFQRKDKSLVVDGTDLEKKNQRKKKGNRKPRPEKDLTGGTEHLLPENVVEAEKIQVVSTERDRDFHRNGKSLVVNGLVWEKKVPVDQSVEIGRSFQNLSVSSGKGGHQRHAWNTRGGQRNYRGGSGRFNDPRLQRPRDSNSVWVRKGEGDTSDANVSRV